MINLNNKRGKFLYKAIYEEFRNLILSKSLKPDEKLPSKRKLAKQLNTSINTITAAYDQLITEGYIYSFERSGYYVEDIPELLSAKNVESEWNKVLMEPTNDTNFQFSLSHMDTNIELFPYDQWKKCEQYAFKNHKQELSRITERQGILSVRKTVADLVFKYRDVNCRPEQIVFGIGTQSLIEQVLNILKEDNSIYLGVENPGYTRLYSQLEHLGIQLNPIDLDEKGISIQNLETSQSNVAFVTPSHQFPTGIIMPVSRRTELLNWAAKDKHRYIIEDDYDSEFKYKTDYIPSLQNADQNDSVIYIGSFSKSLLPSLRISYMVLPKNLVIPYRKKYGHLIPENNSLSLLTLKYFIESGGFDRHIKKMTNYYNEIRKTLIKEIEDIFNSKVTINDTLAGLHFTATFKTNKTYEQIERTALKENFELYTMRRFMLNVSTKDNYITIIIGFGTVKKEDIKPTIAKLYKII